MSDCIQCANCGAVSFYEGGKTKIHCITCYNALRAENERLREALETIANITGVLHVSYISKYAEQALNEVTK